MSHWRSFCFSTYFIGRV